MKHQRFHQQQNQSQSEVHASHGWMQRATVREIPKQEVESEPPIPQDWDTSWAKNFVNIPVGDGLHAREKLPQMKLKIGAVGDKYEQEADRVAYEVVNKINSPGETVQRQEDEEVPESVEEDEEVQLKPLVQRREAMGEGEASPELSREINRARGSGQPLDSGLQQSMGQAMGTDFSGVRIHTDGHADRLNRSLQARAFTTGQDVFFGKGEYQPGSREGQELIAHELTHVVQQSGNTVQRQQPEREEGNKEEDLTLKEEQEWLQAKMQIQRQPATQIQRAWTGRRQLAGLGWLGRPWVFNKSSNLINLRLFHEHIFFEDGKEPPNWGHMGQQGVGTDQTHTQDDYSKVRENLDDAKMRRAVGKFGDPGEYGLLTNNCQDYVQGVLRIYDSL